MQVNAYTGEIALQASQANQLQATESALENQFSEVLAKAAASGDTESQIKAKAKLYESCQALESVFINQMLQSMRSTVPEDSMVGDSFATDTFQSMLYEEYANVMSRSQSFGIAEALYRQLSQQV
jgi:flagellar protein FlgJ